MPDDDLQRMMERALPCECVEHPKLADMKDRSKCPRHEYGDAYLAGLREAKNKGAREMRESLADKMAGWAHHELGDDAIDEAYLIAMKEPLPHPEQESDDGTE